MYILILDIRLGFESNKICRLVTYFGNVEYLNL